MTHHPRQRGQILVIFAGGLVTILVIAALVIDLGFAFMIRRAEQNAADPAAIAAARYIRTGPPILSGGPGTPEPAKMRQAACQYVQQNGFFPGAGGNVDACIPSNDPNGTVLVVNYPPSASAGRFSGTSGYVEVILTRNHQSFLAGVVGIAVIGVSTNAVAAYSAGDSNASSLIALDPGCATGVTAARTHGTGDVVIHPAPGVTDGGYVHVNSTCLNGSADTTCSNSGNGALDVFGDSTLTAPHTYVAGTCKGDPANLIGQLTEGAVQIGDPLEELPPPDFGAPDPGAECGVGSGDFTSPTGPGANGCKFTGGAHTMQPGVYYGGWQISGSSVELILEPGIYVFAGGGVRLTGGGTISSVQGTGAPAPVLFFNTDNPATGTGQEDLDLTAGGALEVHGIDAGPYRGILAWNDGDGSNPTAEIRLAGDVSLDIAGTIYNPKGQVWINGGSDTGSTYSASIQIIAWHWNVGGGALLDMPYDPNELYRFESKGLVR